MRSFYQNIFLYCVTFYNVYVLRGGEENDEGIMMWYHQTRDTDAMTKKFLSDLQAGSTARAGWAHWTSGDS